MVTRPTITLVLSMALASTRLLAAENELKPSQVFNAVSPSIIIVETHDSDGKQLAQGSGVVIAKDTVVTNCHVFKGADTAKVRQQQRRWNAELLNADVDHDLCLLRVPNMNLPAAEFGSTSLLEIGDPVYAIGAPQGLELTLSNGLISSLRPIDRVPVLQITAPISPGSSGGGLFDGHARLIGITTLYFRESQQLNFAVPVEWISDLTRNAEALREGHGRLEPARDEMSAKDAAAAATEAQIAADEAAALQDSAGPAADAAQASADAAASAADAAASSQDVASQYSFESCEESSIQSDKHRVYSYVQGKFRHYSSKPPTGSYSECRVVSYYSAAESQAVAVKDKWKLIYSDESNRIYFDSSTLRNASGVVRLWSKTIYSHPTEIGKSKGIKSIVQSEIFYCAERTNNVTEQVFYSFDGSVIDSRSYSEYEPRREVVPDTVGEVELDAACR